jgi:fructose-1,6-bisphosphatase/inositol monophosphatase family enzyme
MSRPDPAGADTFAPLLRTAVEAVRAAGALARSMQADLKDIRFKGPKDVVTEADLACDAAIRDILAKAHPGHDIVTEEAAALRRAGGDGKDGRHTWFVDPIDGTVNYSRGFALWGVSVGVRQDDAPGGPAMVAGAIWLPVLDELYTATAGGGAFLNGRPLRVSPVDRLEDAIISHGDFNIGSTPEQRNDLNRRSLSARMHTASSVQRVKCLGSAVVEGSLVAAGRMEAYCMLAMKPWDVAVTSLLVREAGGAVSRVDGSPFSVEGPDALFSNGVLHAPLVQLLREDIP